MKKYFVNGKQITKEEADEIQKRNNELMKSDNIADWAKVTPIVWIIADAYVTRDEKIEE